MFDLGFSTIFSKQVSKLYTTVQLEQFDSLNLNSLTT